MICRSVFTRVSTMRLFLGRGSERGRTGRQGLLELLGLLGVLQGQGVQVLGAPDLELDQGALLVLLDPGGCAKSGIVRSLSFVHLPVFSSIAFVTYRRHPSAGRSR